LALLVIVGVASVDPQAFLATVVVLVVAIFLAVLIPVWRRKQARLQAEEESSGVLAVQQTHTVAAWPIWVRARTDSAPTARWDAILP
jgi:membrane protein YdbS with pleckstrin-like domain